MTFSFSLKKRKRENSRVKSAATRQGGSCQNTGQRSDLIQPEARLNMVQKSWKDLQLINDCCQSNLNGCTETAIFSQNTHEKEAILGWNKVKNRQA